MNTPNEVKARAYKLRDVLNVMGHQLNHSESLEVISKIEGYSDWNTYTADIAKNQQNTEPSAARAESNNPGTQVEHPIIDAIKLDNEALLKSLLSEEALSNKSLMSEAFYQTVVLERITLAEVLIEHGADVGSVVIRDLSLCEYAVYIERYDYVKMLVSGSKQLKDIHGKHSKILPGIIRLHDKDQDVIDIVKILLEQGANIDAQDRSGDTALILAGYNREDLELVTYLVEQGADVNIGNSNGDTPLIDAAEKGNMDILKYLLDNGADIDIRNYAGRSALNRAQDRDDSAMISVLLDHNAST